MSYDLQDFVENFKNLTNKRKERIKQVFDKAQGMEEEEALLMFPELRMFKMENNVIKLVHDLFDPIVTICNDHKAKIFSNQNKIIDLNKDIDIVKYKLEDTRSLKEMIDEQHNGHKKLHEDTRKLVDFNNHIVGGVSQQIQSHEEQLQRMAADQNKFEVLTSRYRQEIRQYELLFQDLCTNVMAQINEIRGEVKQQMEQVKSENDVIRNENNYIKQAQKNQKGLINKIDAQIGWQKYNINQLVTLTEDLPVIQKQIQETDHYLHKIQPIIMQSEILKNCKILVSSKEDWEDKLDLLEHSYDKFQDLKEIMDKSTPFDKLKYQFPKDLDEEIQNLKIQIKNAQDNSIMNSDSESSSKKSSDDSDSSEKKQKKKKRVKSEQSSEQKSESNKSTKVLKVNVKKKESQIDTNIQQDLNDEQPEIKQNTNVQQKFTKNFAKKYLLPVNLVPKEPQIIVQKADDDGRIIEAQEVSIVKQNKKQQDDEVKGSRQKPQKLKMKSKKKSIEESQDQEEEDEDDEDVKEKEKDRLQKFKIKNQQKNQYKSPKELLKDQKRETFSSSKSNNSEKKAIRELQISTQQIMREIDKKKDQEKKLDEEMIWERFNKLHRKLKLIQTQLQVTDTEDSKDDLFAGKSQDDTKSNDSYLDQAVTQKEFLKLQKQVMEQKKQQNKLFENLALQRQTTQNQFDDGLNIVDRNVSTNQKDQPSYLMNQQLNMAQQRLTNKQFSDYQGDMLQKLEQIELLKLEMKSQLKRLQQQHLGTHSQYELHVENVKILMEKLNQIEKRLNVGDCAMATIFKLLRINYALIHQDEIDKQSIFLAGFDKVKQFSGDNESSKKDQNTVENEMAINQKEMMNSSIDSNSSVDQSASNEQIKIVLGVNEVSNKSQQFKVKNTMKKRLNEGVVSNQQNKIISFDKNCINCYEKNKQIPNLFKAFKIACLSYKPSKVLFDSKNFERSQLVEVQGYLLYLALEQMKHLNFENADSLLLGDTLRDQDQTSLNSIFGEIKKDFNINSLDTPSMKAEDMNVLLDQSSSLETDRYKQKSNKNNSFVPNTQQNFNSDIPQIQKNFQQFELIQNDNNLSISIQRNKQKQEEGNYDKVVNFAEYTTGMNISTINTNSINQSNQYLLNKDQILDEDQKGLKGKKNHESLRRLSKLINVSNNQTTLSLANQNKGIRNLFGLDTKMISFTKSKEYARLASQIPAIFTIENGKKVLNQSDLINIGITQGGQTAQDQYQKTLNSIKIKKHQLKLQIGEKQISQNNSSEQINKGFLYNQVSRQFKNMTTSPSNDFFNGIQSPESIQFDFKHVSPSLMPQVNFSMPHINFQTQINKQNKLNQIAMGVEGALRNKQNLLIDTSSNNFVNQQFVGNFQNLLTPQSDQNQQIQLQNGGQSILQKLQNQKMNKIQQINSEMKIFKPNLKSNIMSPIITPQRRGIEDESQQQNINFNINQTYDSQHRSDQKNLNNVLISRPIRLNKLDKMSQADNKIQQNDGFENRNVFKMIQQPHMHISNSLNPRNALGMQQNASEKILPFSNQQMLKGGTKFKGGNFSNEIAIINQQNQFSQQEDSSQNKKNQHLQVMGETQRLSNGDSSKNQSGYQISLSNADINKKTSEIGEEITLNQMDIPNSKGYTYDIIIQSAKSNFGD